MKITIYPMGKDNWTWRITLNGPEIVPRISAYNRPCDAERGCYRHIAAMWNESSPVRRCNDWTWREVRKVLKARHVVVDVRR